MTATQLKESTQSTHRSDIESLIDDIECTRQEMKAGFVEFKSELHYQSNRFIAIMIGVMFALSGLILATIEVLF